MEKIKSFEEFQKVLSDSEELQTRFKTDPVKAVNEFTQQNPLYTDNRIYRIIVIGLSITIVSVILGILILMSMGQIDGDKSVPTIVTAIGSASIGAISGLLAPTPRNH